LYNRLKRVHYNLPEKDEKIRWTELAERLKKCKQVLCVVNTRKDCYDLYKLMPEGTIHLSALMCAKHRSKKINLIKEKLKNNEEIRVISTQLIEAGVDIDFPVVFRAFAGLPSIIQTAGRCNREWKAEKGEIFIFNPDKCNPIPAGLMHKSADTAIEIVYQNNFKADDIETEDMSKKFFKSFIKSVNCIGYENYKELLIKDACDLSFQFASYAKDFKIIDDTYADPVIVKYDGSSKLIDELRYCGVSKNLLRKLQRYIVNIPVNTRSKLLELGLLEELCDGIYVQDASCFYSDETGLNIFSNDCGITIGII
jgi:CRISPR-associated endonuclease/helicase Cas3